MSPVLLNIVADMLALIIGRAKDCGKIGGLVLHLVEGGGVSVLQYVDETIIFMEHDLAKARSMKLVLCLFEQFFGLKINFNKSKLFCFGKVKEEEDEYRQLIGCEMGSLQFSYLGTPIHHRNLTNKEWKSIEERFEKKIKLLEGQANVILRPTGLDQFSFDKSGHVIFILL